MAVLIKGPSTVVAIQLILGWRVTYVQIQVQKTQKKHVQTRTQEMGLIQILKAWKEAGSRGPVETPGGVQGWRPWAGVQVSCAPEAERISSFYTNLFIYLLKAYKL